MYKKFMASVNGEGRMTGREARMEGGRGDTAAKSGAFSLQGLGLDRRAVHSKVRNDLQSRPSTKIKVVMVEVVMNLAAS